VLAGETTAGEEKVEGEEGEEGAILGRPDCTEESSAGERGRTGLASSFFVFFSAPPSLVASADGCDS
jgi:hypothetical protein